jgi:hypothetical protein
MTSRSPLDEVAAPTHVPPGSALLPDAKRRPGRPLEMPRPMVLETIRRLALRDEGLFRVHRTHGALYARARRLYGSWATAVAEAGVDYGHALATARRRATEARSSKSRILQA